MTNVQQHEADRQHGDEVRARLAAISPTPWRAEHHDGQDDDWPVYDAHHEPLCTSPDDGVRGGHSGPDADLIAHAPADLAQLLERAERAEAQVARYEALSNNASWIRAKLRHAPEVEVTDTHKTWRYPNGTTLTVARVLLEEDDPDRIALCLQHPCCDGTHPHFGQVQP